MSLTARELARRVARNAEETQTVFERIRHWTREGLLQVEGELNPGTGRNREFPDSALKRAKVFNILAEFGVGLKVIKPVARFMDEDYLGIFEGTDKVLILSMQSDGRYKVGLQYSEYNSEIDGIYAPIQNTSDCSIVINVSRILAS